ncbi:hypothetical protein KBD61_04480 [Patescibacteria group bacterium]|nr:hypothetical protein [Patescibacteria group bacterium]MBP9710251.1 hypothetical protein [Patescibacteria group bacterium]
MKASLPLLMALLLVVTGSGCGNKVEEQAVLARQALRQLSSVESCRDLEAIMSPKLYEALGPCDERLRFDEATRNIFKTEVESCVLEEHLTKGQKEFAVEGDEGYSIVFRCAAPKEEGGGTNYVLLRQIGASYQIVNMTSHPIR